MNNEDNFPQNPCHHSPVPCGGEITQKKPSCSLGFLLGCSLLPRHPSIACKSLFIPLQAMFHFRLLLGEKCALNRPFGLPGQRGLPSAGSAHATGIRRPLQPPVVVDSNPDTLMTNKPRTLSGAGLVHQGWTMGFEPTTTGTTIRGSTAELRPPSIVVCNTRLRGNYTQSRGECKPKVKKSLFFFFLGCEITRNGAGKGRRCG